MVFEVFHFPNNKAVHLSDWNLISLVHEDTDATQVLCRNHLVFALRFQLKNKIKN